MAEEAVDRYHSLLDDQLAADTSADLYTRLKPQGLYFGERPISTVIRPHFYLSDEWEYLKRETETLLSAFSRLHAACLTDSALRSQLDLEPYEENLFSLDIGGAVPWTTSRLDSFFLSQEKKLYFVEYNAETPAGMGYEDALSELFMTLEPMKRFMKYYAVQSMPMCGKLSHHDFAVDKVLRTAETYKTDFQNEDSFGYRRRCVFLASILSHPNSRDA